MMCRHVGWETVSMGKLSSSCGSRIRLLLFGTLDAYPCDYRRAELQPRGLFDRGRKFGDGFDLDPAIHRRAAFRLDLQLAAR
jgi:hypothetical protein